MIKSPDPIKFTDIIESRFIQEHSSVSIENKPIDVNWNFTHRIPIIIDGKWVNTEPLTINMDKEESLRELEKYHKNQRNSVIFFP